jgi:predicted metal-dependent phosphoesterase TrpH
MNISVDFHCHTIASKDSLTTPDDLIRSARRRGLAKVVITDHNTIAGAVAAYTLDPELIIIGEEVMTTCGEILAFFVIREIPAGLSPLDTVNRLRDQGAFISISHPFDSWREGAWKMDDLLVISPLVDAIEIFNARSMRPKANQFSSTFATQNHIPGTAGSDAHTDFEVGAARLVVPQFGNSEELRIVISQGNIKGNVSPYWVHLFSRYASFRKRVV